MFILKIFWGSLTIFHSLVFLIKILWEYGILQSDEPTYTFPWKQFHVTIGHIIVLITLSFIS